LPRLDLLTRIDTPQVEEVAPQPVTPAVDSAASAIPELIKQRLLGWSRAWSNADVESYLSNYSSHFQPDDAARDYNQWRNIRRARLQLASNTEVTLQDIRVYLDDESKRAIAEFIQSYRSDSYQDRVRKQLLMAYENERWLILSERVIEQLN
jgi:adhesin transport system outer membrane protein